MKRFAAKTAPAALVALGAGMLLASGALAAGFAPAPGSPFPTETPPVYGDDCWSPLATGDLNNDGNLDVVVGCTDKVAVLLGDGHGGLAQAPGSPYRMDGMYPDAIGVADFNGDGNEDVVLASGNDAVSTLFGDGTGRLVHAPHSPATTGDSSALGIADFNGDGKPDVAIAQFFGPIHVFLARGMLGDLDFVPGNTFNGGGGLSRQLAVADFNLDGRPDLAVVNNFTGKAWVLLGDGQGHFSPAPGSPFPTGGPQPTGIGAADFNGDGVPDLAIANYPSNVSVLLGDRNGGMTPAPGSPLTIPAINPGPLATGDFNRDGRLDVALSFVYDKAPDGSYVRTNDVWILLGDGKGGLSVAPGSPVETGGRGLGAMGDFNGDARPDLVVGGADTPYVGVLLNYKSAAKLCDAQRSAMGSAAFDERYGSNGIDANAYGKCVTQNKGF